MVLSLGATLILILAGLFAVRMVFLRTQNKVSVVIPVVLGLLAIVIFGGLTEEHGSGPDSEPHADSQFSTVSLTPSPSEETETRDFDHFSEFSDDGNAQPALRIEETEHGNMLVLPLSASALGDFLGPDAQKALQKISSAVPPQLRQAYALVPIPGPVGDAVPGIQALASAIAHIAETTYRPDETDTPEADASTEETAADLQAEGPQPVARPNWIDQPGENRLVVKTKLIEADQPIESVLEPAVAQALLESSRQIVGVFWPRVMRTLTLNRRFGLTADAVADCVLDRHDETVVFDTREGPVAMQYSFALVEFPPAVKAQGVAFLRESLQHQRTWSIAAILVGLGLVVMLATGILQLASAPGRLTRIVGMTVLTLILLPGLALTGQLVRTVATNRSLPLPDSLHLLQLPDAVITTAAESKSFAPD